MHRASSNVEQRREAGRHISEKFRPQLGKDLRVVAANAVITEIQINRAKGIFNVIGVVVHCSPSSPTNTPNPIHVRRGGSGWLAETPGRAADYTQTGTDTN